MADLKRTALFETHKQLGARMAPFGGWEMPLWYASAREEHLAVRTAAGLFDVSHMGVFDARGPDAGAFLDHVGTNDVSKLAVGRSHYSYLLDERGDVVDDIMVYRLEAERYMVVVNAANNDKDWVWLRAQVGDFRCTLRDLRDLSSGADRRVDLALQGPKSLEILQRLLPDDQRATLGALPYTGVMRASLAGHHVFISRTGYTGERIAYEVFVHPGESVALWHALLDAGRDQGLKPCGLAARDSLRIEAGLPLYGHELAGPLNLAPYHIGFDNFVKTDKPAEFIGKAAYKEKAARNTAKLVRFRMNEKGVRPSKLGDPVLDKRGRVIGTVTSCAQDGEGYLLGLALVERSAGVEEGSVIYVVALPERMPEPLKPFAPLGSRALMPDAVTVLSRFPPRRG
ncbi:MAG: glycine cleavage system aminomethyltransferase GcvT [Chloroflexi bacterium]|jgi:glycine hydroxymethyltransferase|uniref:Glycine cleavage system protein T n=1 Tax=Candidatus Thermofonsia Clade 3 bacterium TaxID=2364212 RepID=A0A2M8QF90_9CHLR|nr:glycine cleavage system aminomethyltransferase GcvT [Candidatus Roseilinea sp. NK_OTU-006]PJF48428.1 MAG: glycine cleavage system protein T [Candidatus Thermofonsia Clade 3 bacterium]RMG62106.1 MAG: glycine cleavage system aminomethyltransferase GcvT [Chloroflexota bacterium]